MQKIYYLKTCDTCKRIMKQIADIDQYELQNIKDEPVTAQQLDEMKALAGSYEKLFSRRAKLYAEMGLKNEKLSEDDYKHYILQHYTFLKRPVIIKGDKITIGKSPEE